MTNTVYIILHNIYNKWQYTMGMNAYICLMSTLTTKFSQLSWFYNMDTDYCVQLYIYIYIIHINDWWQEVKRLHLNTTSQQSIPHRLCMYQVDIFYIYAI